MDRFWNKVNKTDSCWLWIGSKNPKGYGKVKYKRKTIAAHRFSYELHYGPIPIGMYVCHKCDIRNCVNPEHLFLGTAQDNMDDKVNKGRQGKGGGRQRKLTKDQIKEIQSLYVCGYLQGEIAEMYNVSSPTIARSLDERLRGVKKKRRKSYEN